MVRIVDSFWRCHLRYQPEEMLLARDLFCFSSRAFLTLSPFCWTSMYAQSILNRSPYSLHPWTNTLDRWLAVPNMEKMPAVICHLPVPL